MSQRSRLFTLLYDLQPHRTDQIVREVYGDRLSLSRVAARIYDLKHKGYDITGWKDRDNPTLYWYRLNSRLAINRPQSRPEEPVPPLPARKVRNGISGTQGVLFYQDQHGEAI